MKRLALFAVLVFGVSVAFAGPPQETLINAGARHVGDIKMGAGSVRVMEDADVVGNIFIEEGDLFIGSEVDINGSITIKIKGTMRVMEDADVVGNIFIEEGDLFIANDVDINGSITIKKGNIFIKDRVELAREIVLLNGAVEMGSGCHSEDGILAGGGAVSMRDNNTVQGDIKAATLTQGRNNTIKGKFIKTPK